jgi:cold shock CspA family protein
METGKIRTLVADRGFGFIRDSYGAEYFFHASNAENFEGLAVGDGVAFDIGTGRGGRHAAIAVRAL